MVCNKKSVTLKFLQILNLEEIILGPNYEGNTKCLNQLKRQ